MCISVCYTCVSLCMRQVSYDFFVSTFLHVGCSLKCSSCFILYFIFLLEIQIHLDLSSDRNGKTNVNGVSGDVCFRTINHISFICCHYYSGSDFFSGCCNLDIHSSCHVASNVSYCCSASPEQACAQTALNEKSFRVFSTVTCCLSYFSIPSIIPVAHQWYVWGPHVKRDKWALNGQGERDQSAQRVLCLLVGFVHQPLRGRLTFFVMFALVGQGETQ